MAGEIIYDHPPVRARRCRHGALIYFSNDEYIGRSLDIYGEYSEGEIDLFRQIARPGNVVLDIGANIGVFTVYLAQAVGGPAIAFEPQRALYYILCGNLALNGLSNVTATHGALGAEPGHIFVPAVDYAKGGNFGGMALPAYAEVQAIGEQVAVSTIDLLKLERCDVIKIDVEGMETDVLAGATDTLNRCKPLLYVENDRPEKSAAVIRMLFERDYRLYWHLPRLYNPDNFLGRRDDAFPGVASINMLCVPRSLPIRVQFHEVVSPDEDWHVADALGIELMRLERTLADRPDDLPALNGRGLTLHRQRRFEEALQSYDRALAIKPDVVEILYNRGNTLVELRRYDEALASFDAALAVAPDFVIALNNRGWVLQRLGRREEALASYDKALAAAPEHATTLANRALLLDEIERASAAAAAAGGTLVAEGESAPAGEGAAPVAVETAERAAQAPAARADAEGEGATIAAEAAEMPAERADAGAQTVQAEATAAAAPGPQPASPIPTGLGETLALRQRPRPPRRARPMPAVTAPARKPSQPGKFYLKCTKCGKRGQIELKAADEAAGGKPALRSLSKGFKRSAKHDRGEALGVVCATCGIEVEY